MKWENIIGDNENQNYIDENTLSCRYLLEKKGKKELIVLGLNPSTADSVEPDRTMCRVMHYAEQENFDGFAMINLYPQRATQPQNLKIYNNELHQKNLSKIKTLVASIENPVILLAFGGNITKVGFLQSCFIDIYNVLKTFNPSWKCLDIGKTGIPKHPLYLKNELRMKDFDIDKFIGTLKI
ncbi:MAG: DUF1643 domain-containing protein [Treponema sp.]|nr:DUF1643 domain-containing protein [Treponema sp.]